MEKEGEMEGLCVTTCTRCDRLVESRSQIVNGVGPGDADVLIVGEAPGADEDRRGEPFVGRSGKVLDEKLRDVGLERDAVRITNCVRCRPPENRDPVAAELANCRPWLEAEIERVDPDVIVTVGKVPSSHLLERDVAVTKEAGTVVEREIGGAIRRILLSVHPAAMLYDRSQEETLERTMAKAAALAGVDGGRGDVDIQSELGEF